MRHKGWSKEGEVEEEVAVVVGEKEAAVGSSSLSVSRVSCAVNGQ